MPAVFNTVSISAIVACICAVVAAVPEKLDTIDGPVGVPNPDAIGHEDPPVTLAEMTFVALLIDQVTPPPSASVNPRAFSRKLLVSATVTLGPLSSVLPQCAVGAALVAARAELAGTIAFRA